MFLFSLHTQSRHPYSANEIAPGITPPLLWRRPKAASIMVDGEVANIGKTYANMYRIFMYMYISHILIYFPYVIPGAISLAKSGCLYKMTYNIIK